MPWSYIFRALFHQSNHILWLWHFAISCGKMFYDLMNGGSVYKYRSSVFLGNSWKSCIFFPILTWNIYIQARLKADQFLEDHDIDLYTHIAHIPSRWSLTLIMLNLFLIKIYLYISSLFNIDMEMVEIITPEKQKTVLPGWSMQRLLMTWGPFY